MKCQIPPRLVASDIHLTHAALRKSASLSISTAADGTKVMVMALVYNPCWPQGHGDGLGLQSVIMSSPVLGHVLCGDDQRIFVGGELQQSAGCIDSNDACGAAHA